MIKQEYVKPGARFKLVIPDPMPEVGFTGPNWQKEVKNFHGQIVTIKSADPNGPCVVVSPTGERAKPAQGFVLVEGFDCGIPFEWLTPVSDAPLVLETAQGGIAGAGGSLSITSGVLLAGTRMNGPTGTQPSSVA